MNDKFLLDKEKALHILFFEQHKISLEALGLLVILIKMNCIITFEKWMEEFGGGWNGWSERLFKELIENDVLKREDIDLRRAIEIQKELTAPF